MTKYVVVAVLAAWCTSGVAYTGVSTSVSNGALSHLSFLDPSRLDIDNSLFFGYSSDGRSAQGGGAFMTTLGYSIHPRLTVRATLSKQFTFLGRGPSDEGISLSGLELAWAPSKALFIHIAFSAPPSYAATNSRALIWR